jgi:3-hydroxyacyl-CoA dehydrogenase
MKIDEVKKIAVIGAGDMGNGIAQLGIMAGYRVAMRDIEQRFVDKGVATITGSLEKMVSKGKVAAEARDAAMARLVPIVDMEAAVKDADIVVEAVPEIMELKKKVFADLDRFTPRHAVLATNTSNMSITEIALATSRPDKVVGMHFFNPAVLLKLVEVIKGDSTSDEAMQVIFDLALKMKKMPVKVLKDSPGFIYNRVNAPTGLLLAKIIELGKPTPSQFDAVFKPFMPMTPFELVDFVGVDVAYHSQDYFAKTLSADYTPGPVYKAMVDSGSLGKKTGKGFYDWSAGRPQIDVSNPTTEFEPTHMIALQVNEATKILEESVCADPKEIDLAVANGGGGIGPFTLAQSIGYDVLVAKCNELADRFKLNVFRPTKTMSEGKIAV